MKIFFAGLFFAIYAGTLAAASRDDDFMAMRQAFQVGDSARVTAYAQRLRGHVLEPYAIYYQLRPQLENSAASEETINAFLKRYQDSPLSDRLQGEWLKTLGETQQWDLFASAYPDVINKDTELICYSLQKRLAANDSSAFAEVRPLWFNARDLPESCTPLFDTLVTAGVLTVEDVWTRLRLALEAGSVGVAKRINEYLPESQALNERKLASATENPLRYLEKHRREITTRADREIALFAILRLIRSSPDQAYAYWPRIREQFSEPEHSYFLVQLADQAARRLNPRALGWFMEAASTSAPVPLSDAQLGWKTRAALRAGDWNLVMESIEAMSTPEQQTGVWRYWKARALKSRGKTTEANVILAPLSTEHNFYGQLAEEELGVTIGTPAESYKPSKNEIAATERLPGIKRALALYRLNLRTEATREWVWAIRDFDDQRLLAAAEVARRNGIYDRAINTAERTVKDHDFSLRFLAPHRDAMRDILKQQELDEAWVYGLIRQESRFISDARSSAGAMGLMQLMPGTAKWVSKKMGVRKYRPALVTEVNTNLKLGTYYLKHVLTLSDNQPLLASAGYNAGPSRVSQWRDEKQPLEGAIYAETIPFNETRDYVKKVLSNSMYYARSFGHQVTALKSRLGIVASRSGGEKFSEEK
ncbi:lytic transglycosylase domain-containing protein [Nitrosovibrio sp. Nv4]|uniref:lytic transglycosylase domain-containing protein n=1 Tax=Nitrosovibrio sp. Nv4 TaxID=1945880 RepID=UPI000BD47158|nr:lytic transglycosylase domain-containing protein [Nitrosovibrio sp. Nv4]SOD39897.1 soluble lytic murein transglycosylase [Nitrosovibrio sp. Nv4]